MTTSALIASACSGDRATSPTMPRTASLSTTAPIKKPARMTISNVTVSAGTFVIGGPGVSYDVTISNPTSASATGVSIDAEIDQGSAKRAAGGAPADCGSGSGIVGPGSCTMTLTATASNTSAGNGTLMQGSAKLVVRLNQSDGTTTVTVDTKTVKIPLTAETHTQPYIANVVLDFTSLQIGGAQGNGTITVQNPTAVNQAQYLFQATVVQGAVFAGASGSLFVCGSNGVGVLPPGPCTMTFPTGASNQFANGTFVAGPAVWRVELLYYDGVTNTLVDFREINITLTGP